MAEPIFKDVPELFEVILPFVRGSKTHVLQNELGEVLTARTEALGDLDASLSSFLYTNAFWKRLFASSDLLTFAMSLKAREEVGNEM